MAVNAWAVRRVSIVANPRTFGMPRYEEKYKELSRLQKCPILRTASTKSLSNGNLLDSFIKALKSLVKLH
ncbi:MAG: hypothetical protein C5B53_00690 [Candidatus Melainabacteria bacterium]|nr:MAG: hypothetical protein C5B53_00690 [Candidatus Melainabacteria bacterium]